MPTIYSWRRDFSPWSCCCSTDRMCGMRVCEWTQRELTLDIRFTPGDYDPGHSGRNREKRKAKPRPIEERERRRERGESQGRMEQRPWDGMRCLISPGQVRSDTGWVSDLMYSLWKNGYHTYVCYIYIIHSATFSLFTSLVYSYFSQQIPRAMKISPKSRLYLPKFP